MKKLLLSILIVGFLVSSCDVVNFDDDINKNPNLPGKGNPSQLIANAMLSLPSLSSSPQGEYNAQYLSQLVYVAGSFYPKGTTSFYSFYEGPLVNLQKAIKNTDKTNEEAVAKILKAYFYWHITDRWGDIPYSEALNGAEKFTPSYDKQQDIYDDMFAKLKEASGQLKTSQGLDDDIVFNGDIDKWRKFSNTVRMLMALRLSKVDAQNSQKYQKEFNEALSDGVMDSNEDSFVYKHLNSENNENYWYNQIVRQTRVWWAIPSRLIGMMQPNDDPRLSVYAEKAEQTNSYNGLAFGTKESNVGATKKYSLLGNAIYQQDSPIYLTTYAQSRFARAEAAARNWTTEDVETQYNEAMRASVTQWTGSNNGLSALMQKQPYDNLGTAKEDEIEQISNQRYIHLFMNGYEAWAEYRRTGYPDNMVQPKGRDVPRRQAYTSDEKLNNTENFNKAVDRQFNGNNTINGRVWWDVK